MRNPKHFKASMMKSGVRIFGCIVAIIKATQGDFCSAITILGSSFLVGEFIGIIEEFVD